MDSVIIESFESHQSLTRVALRDQRMILTKSRSNFDAARKSMKNGHCFLVRPDKVDEQLAEIRRYFNLNISEEDIFVRCSLCNGDRYITISRTLMKQMRGNKAQVRSGGYNMVPDGFDDDEEDGNYELGDECDFDDEEEDHPLGAPSWLTIDGVELNPSAAVTKDGVELRVTEVEAAVVDKYEEFYCCSGCGKVFWQGSHWGKMQDKVFGLKPPVLKLV